MKKQAFRKWRRWGGKVITLRRFKRKKLIFSYEK